MKIFIVRHGETDANKDRIIQGQTDYPLNDNGINLAKKTGKAIDYIKFKKAYTSPLERAYDTCRHILNESGNKDTLIIKDDRLLEFNFGIFEGVKLDDRFLKNCPEEFETFFSDTYNYKGFNGSESTEDVIKRTKDFLIDLSKINDDDNYLVVSHGGSIRAMLNMFYKDKEEFWHKHVPYNCSINIVEAKDNKLRLIGDDLIFYDKDEIRDNYVVFKKV